MPIVRAATSERGVRSARHVEIPKTHFTHLSVRRSLVVVALLNADAPFFFQVAVELHLVLDVRAMSGRRLRRQRGAFVLLVQGRGRPLSLLLLLCHLLPQDISVGLSVELRRCSFLRRAKRVAWEVVMSTLETAKELAAATLRTQGPEKGVYILM